MVNGNRYRFRQGLVIAALVLGLAVAGVGIAQTTGTIEGTVADQSGGVLPGVTVELAGPNLQGTRSAVTGADGRYRFPSVPPGPYTVTGDLSGFGRVSKKAVVTLDATASVNLQMNLSASAEVTVSGEAPLVDSTSTTTGSNYNAKTIDKLPVGRNYADIVFAQPGVQQDFGETQGRSLAISVYGSTSSENQFLIDGVNTTNVIKGFQGKDINNEFVQEVEVKTGGYQAEYGRNTGGVINVITKSGGNEFHGGAFGYYNNTGMRADIDANATPDYSETGDAQTAATTLPNSYLSGDNRQEWGMDLGGFMLKDKIWFFGAYDRVQVNQELTPLGGPPGVVGENFPIGYVQNKYSGKLTLNLAQGTSVIGSVFSDSQQQNGAIAVPTSTDPFSYNGRIDTGGPDYAARLNQLFGSVGIFTFQYSQHSDRYTTKPFGVENVAITDFTPNAFGQDAIVYNGFGNVFGPVANNSSKREAYGGSFTGYIGNHELKAGGDYQKDDTFGSTYYTGGQRLRVRPCLQDGGANQCDLSQAPVWTNQFGETIPVFYQHDFYTANGQDLTPLTAAPFNTPTNRWSAFLQDQWRIIPTLTVNLGVRYDSEDLKRGDGVTAFQLQDQWAPRIGFVWDFTGDGTSKLYGSVGRFYYAIPTDLNVRVFTANTSVRRYNYDTNSLDQNSAAPRGELIQVGSVLGEPVDAGIKAAYQDEATIGVEKALDPTLSIGLKGTYRTLGRTIEDRCDLDPNGPTQNSCALFNPGGTGPAASGQYLSCDGSGNPTDPTSGECGLPGVAVQEAKRIFRGIEMTARKQFTNALWAQASFLYSSLRGNYSGAIREASGQTDPGINADYDYHQFLTNAYGNLELDRPVQARIDAVYTAPFGLSAGLGFYVRSGLPLSRQGWFNDFYPTELYLDQRGSDGRTPTDYEMNLSMSYNLNVGPVTITPMLYVFNVLNRQTPLTLDQTFNPNASFVTNPASPYYGQAGVEPGTAGPDGTVCQSSTPCTDNPDYLKVAPNTLGLTSRTAPRLIRAALKITF
jgi:outer membrane receptor protein involved in Fe transport